MISFKLPDETDDVAAAEAVASLKIFDFSDMNLRPVDSMDEHTKSVYYRLKRAASLAPGGEYKADEGKGNASLLPDGKIYTEADVIEILGEDYATGLAISTNCCE